MAPAPVDHAAVGSRLRDARKSRRLTLVQLSALSGVAVSTISKAERGEIALTYDKFAALGRGLRLDLGNLFAEPAGPARPMSPCLTRRGAEVLYETAQYGYGMLAAGLQDKRMVPMLARIHARSMGEFPSFIRHEGQEFVYVLSGSLRLCFEDGSFFDLGAGDSLYFESSLGHLYLSRGRADCRALVCCADAAAHPAHREL